MAYEDTRWPWHVEVIKTDGTVDKSGHRDDCGAVNWAQQASINPGVERVELSVTFVNGVAITPAAAARRENRGMEIVIPVRELFRLHLWDEAAVIADFSQIGMDDSVTLTPEQAETLGLIHVLAAHNSSDKEA